ncbi:unnamed protein product [Psylliodes chrysocephalus]|uniref:Myb/SANT-like DNA-binding domain-containing protein n=1 Tax=Psylliodes chrysocephalus TaxID=3402493 RepID=A0A9P0G8D0_9CUCU|nr:unnamed protein product [Psylliodes chrysocephala]
MEEEKYQISINCKGRDYLVVVDDLETATQLVNGMYKYYVKKPTERDIETTKVLLTLRQRDFRLFDDKKTSKRKLWNEIADTLKQYGFNVGPNRGERRRQKFSNLIKSYISYVKNQTVTGAERNDNIPPFYEELHSILGSKKK